MLTRSEHAVIFYNDFYYFILQKPNVQSFSLLVRPRRGNLRDVCRVFHRTSKISCEVTRNIPGSSVTLGNFCGFMSVERNSDHFSRHFAFQLYIFHYNTSLNYTAKMRQKCMTIRVTYRNTLLKREMITMRARKMSKG